MAKSSVELPVIDLGSDDRIWTAKCIREACIESGFFYLVNHGVDSNLLDTVFQGSRTFFHLPLHHKTKLHRIQDIGYTPLYAENLDPSYNSKGDLKESFDTGPLQGMNQWPSEEVLPGWRSMMEEYYKQILGVGERVISLIALALKLEEKFFHDLGALSPPTAFLRITRYPGEVGEEIFGASAHSDFGMLTLLATDGVPGLQVCKDKFKNPRLWQDVQHIPGAFVVNIGDLMERWTNCLFRSTLHRVLLRGQERYSVAFFIHPNPDCVVQCLKSCCDDSTPPRFPPIRSGDYLHVRRNDTYAS